LSCACAAPSVSKVDKVAAPAKATSRFDIPRTVKDI
jgi:hypothetical protein